MTNATETVETTTANDERCKHGQVLTVPCQRCAKAADKARRVKPAATEPVVIAAVDESTPVVATVEPSAPVTQPVALDTSIAQIFNPNGMVHEMPVGAHASECRHRELDTLLPHVAVPKGTSEAEVVALLALRGEKFLQRPKIQRLIAAKAKA